MARGINKVILIGNLGKDPEIRYMPNGGSVVNFSIATSESWKDDMGQKNERTEWHNCVAYGKTAELIGQYLKKGSKAFIEGSLRTRKWQDKTTGQDRYTTEINVRDVQFLDSNAGVDSHHVPGQNTHQTSSRPPPRQQIPAEDEFFDDDIPF